jgi:hypothetical protein
MEPLGYSTSTRTLHRGFNAGQLATTTTSGRYVVAGEELARFAWLTPHRTQRPLPGLSQLYLSRRGTKVIRDPITTQVEIQSESHHVVSVA